MALSAMIATFLMAFFAKKALLISLATFALVIHDKFKKKGHTIHYHVEPSHKTYLIDKYHMNGGPHKYAVYSDGYQSSHKQNVNSDYKVYDDVNDFLLQGISADSSKWY